MRKIFKKYILVIGVILPVLIILAARTLNISGFKYDAKKWSMPSFNNSNLISLNMLESLTGEKLIVNLDTVILKGPEKSISTITIQPREVLKRKNLRVIRKQYGPVLLYSCDPALVSRIWMILSQTGLRNLYILTGENDNEKFKNRFRPETLIRPQL